MNAGQRAILIVEDNLNEQLLIKSIFEGIGVKDKIYCVTDGSDAIAYLKGEEQYSDRDKYKFPTFVLTDLNLPRVNGFELLLYVKRSQLITMPTIVLTGSSDRDDIKKAYQFGANGYHIKPGSHEKFSEVLKMLYTYWTNVELPELDKNGRLLDTDDKSGTSEKMRHPVNITFPGN